MELEYSREIELAHETLQQLKQTIVQLQDWNKDVESMQELETSPYGMQRLAGNFMLIQVIGESVKKIDNYTNGSLWQYRPEIPWKKVIAMRNRISHGYHDLDIEYMDDIIKNDLAPLLEAVEYLLKITDELYLTV
jgi:uncharacterized protein with HEPN domain